MGDVAWKWVRIGRKIRDLRRFGVFKCVAKIVREAWHELMGIERCGYLHNIVVVTSTETRFPER